MHSKETKGLFCFGGNGSKERNQRLCIYRYKGNQSMCALRFVDITKNKENEKDKKTMEENRGRTR